MCILQRCESRTYNKGVTTLHVIDKLALYRSLLYYLFEVACIVCSSIHNGAKGFSCFNTVSARVPFGHCTTTIFKRYRTDIAYELKMIIQIHIAHHFGLLRPDASNSAEKDCCSSGGLCNSATAGCPFICACFSWSILQISLACMSRPGIFQMSYTYCCCDNPLTLLIILIWPC